jgi:outer membrane protein OmpA-like peptidoglycan-associated protein
MKNIFFFFVLLVCSLSFSSAQVAGEMDILLETPQISFAQASRFTLVVANIIDEKTEPPAAYALALERGWLPKKAQADNLIRLDELCALVMEAFAIKGSFLYTWFPGPRYAFREMDYLRLIPGQRDPALRVSGEQLLQILGMAANYTKIDDRIAEEEARRRAAEEESLRTAALEESRRLAEENARYIAALEEARRRAAEEEALRTAALEESRRLAEENARYVAALEEVRRRAAEEEAPRIAEDKAQQAADAALIGSLRIVFAANTVGLKEAERVKLGEIIPILERYSDKRILVAGYTALAGNLEGRVQISTGRARAVADYLVSLNVRHAAEIVIRGYGAQRPLGDNATAEGRALNRRVEITFIEE